eukprot:TRINITY_DN2751_c0_g1_i2.p2 TRINITY_DN2751_c0_g1~~TRINITY_DN2751_c0_g1_i2.p2  ORF type:complete len:102 (-),score=8.43 TRINITY_DN2751_c0_g1_i2:235-540(-)
MCIARRSPVSFRPLVLFLLIVSSVPQHALHGCYRRGAGVASLALVNLVSSRPWLVCPLRKTRNVNVQQVWRTWRIRRLRESTSHGGGRGPLRDEAVEDAMD